MRGDLLNKTEIGPTVEMCNFLEKPMQMFNVRAVSKAALALTFSAVCVCGQASQAGSSLVPLRRRPTPTVPPVPTQTMTTIDDQNIAALLNPVEALLALTASDVSTNDSQLETR